MVRVCALLLLLPLLACPAHGLREAVVRRQDPAPLYKTGDLMEYEVLEGEDAGNWVKCSITGPGDLPDTYNVFAWSSDPHRRRLTNIPAELLKTQAEMEAKRQAAEEQRLKEEAERKAREEEERRIREAEEKERMEREERERAEQEEKERLEKEEEARQLHLKLKAHWEEVKAAKRKAIEEARARGEIVEEQPERRKAPQPTDPENIQVVLKFDGKPDLSMKVNRQLRLRSLMSVAAETMGVKMDDVRFHSGAKIFKPEETAARFGNLDKVVVNMELVESRLRTPMHLKQTEGKETFDVGDFALANVSTGEAVPCIIHSKGSLPDSFDIKFMFSNEGLHDLAHVPTKLMRKVSGKQYAGALKKFREDPVQASKALQHLASHVDDITRSHAKVKLAETGLAPPGHRVGQLDLTSEGAEPGMETFARGNFVEFHLKDGSVVPATVTGVEPPNSYNLHVLFAPGLERKLRDLRAVPGHMLKSMKAKAYVEQVRNLKQDPEQAIRLLEQASRETGSAL